MTLPNFKPAKGTAGYQRAERKAQAKRQLAKAMKADKLAQAKAWREVRLATYLRDQGRCRVCGVKLRFDLESPFNAAHPHHVIYKSAGGKDTTENVATLCPEHHNAEHLHFINIEGNADAKLTLTVYDKHYEIQAVREI